MQRIILFSFLSFMLIAQMIPQSVQCSVVNQCAPLAACCLPLPSAISALDEQDNCCSAPGCNETENTTTDSSDDCCKPFQQQYQTWTTFHNDVLISVSDASIIAAQAFQTPININQDDNAQLLTQNTIKHRPIAQMPSTAALLCARCVRLLI